MFEDMIERVAEFLPRLSRIDRQPLICDLSPEVLDHVQLWCIGRQVFQQNTLLRPALPILREVVAIVDGSIIKHDPDGKTRLLASSLLPTDRSGELIDARNDHIGGDRLFEDIAVELIVALQQPDDVQSLVMAAAASTTLAVSVLPCIGNDWPQ